jgi:hypothetical protein
VKRMTLRAMIVAAVLILGSVAFAIAVSAQSPGASQIPTVVSSQPTASPAVHALVTTSTVPVSADSTKAAKPTTPKPDSHAEKPARSDSSASEREVVTPGVRDDGDADENGGKSDNDRDDEESSNASHKAPVHTASASASRPSHSHRRSFTTTHKHTVSVRHTTRLRIAASSGVERNRSKGKNVRGHHN